MKESSKREYGGQIISIGLDVHKRFWYIGLVLMGRVLKKFRMDAAGPAGLVGHLHKHYPGAQYRSAYEAGYCGYWTHCGLLELGVANRLVNAAGTPTRAKKRRHKTIRSIA